jgi:hypothetical protein
MMMMMMMMIESNIKHRNLIMMEARIRDKW